MIQNHFSNHQTVPASFKFCCLCFLILIFSQSVVAATPVVRDGILDLKGFSFEKNEIINLNGEWEFYWQQLLSPNNFRSSTPPSKTGNLEIPGYWNGFIHEDVPLSGMGYATFRMTIQNVTPDQMLAIDLPLLHTAYKLWINGKVIAQSGTVGRSPDEAIPRFLAHSKSLLGNSDQIEIILQVSNYSHARGGIWQTIRLGTQEAMEKLVRNRIAFEMILFGAILIMAIYYLGFFALRLQEPSALAFSIFCFSIAFRVIAHGSTRLIAWFPDMDWELMLTLDYLTLPVAFISICSFIYFLFPEDFDRRVLKTLTGIGILISFLICCAPARIYTEHLIYMHIYIFGFFLYALFAILKAVWKKRENASLVFSGCVIMFIAFINDMLYVFEVIHTSHLLSLGLLTFLCMLSFVLSKRFSRALSISETLSLELEKIVGERTQELKVALQEISQKSDDRKEIIHILCHDLANPIGSVLLASELFDTRDLTVKEYQKYVKTYSQAGLDIIQMIKEIMTLEKGDLQVETELLDLKKMIENSILLIKPQFVQKGITPVIKVDPGTNVRVEKTFFMNSVLNNLFTNAIKFSTSGSEIFITSQKTATGVELLIQDSGIGIPEKMLKDIFDISKKTTRIGTDGETGTGFGMPLVKKLITSFGGDISIQSTPKTGDGSNKHGTTIRLFLMDR